MKTYYNLIQKMCNFENTVDLEFNENIYNLEKCKKQWNLFMNQKDAKHLNHIYFLILQLQKTHDLNEFIHKKFSKIHDYINTCFMKDIYDDILDVLCVVQKHYNAFSKLARIYKYSKKPSVNTDLLLCPITDKDRHIKIIHENILYMFTIKDLINIINTSLSNCSSFYAEPKPIKNPYNNLLFNNSSLYNIYFAIKNSDYLMPVLFHQYFLCHFNIINFGTENEYLIRDTYIKRLVYNTNQKNLFDSMKRMIEKNFSHIRINKNIDKDEFIKIMRPYYYLYLTSSFHVHGVEKTYKSLYIFKNKIRELYEYNCRFGRVYYKRQPITRKFRHISDLDHPKFTMQDAVNYELYDNNYIYNNRNSIFHYENNIENDDTAEEEDEEEYEEEYEEEATL